MIKTSIDLTAEQYHFLKIKALDRKMRGEDPSFVTIIRELIEEERQQTAIRHSSTEKNNKQLMIKTSIDLTAEHYHYLKMQALDRKMRGEDPSFVTLLRELIEEDRKKWQAKTK